MYNWNQSAYVSMCRMSTIHVRWEMIPTLLWVEGRGHWVAASIPRSLTSHEEEVPSSKAVRWNEHFSLFSRLSENPKKRAGKLASLPVQKQEYADCFRRGDISKRQLNMVDIFETLTRSRPQGFLYEIVYGLRLYLTPKPQEKA